MGTGNDPQLDFWLPDLGRGQSHPVVAALGRLQAPAKRGAMDCCHRRLGGILKVLDNAGQPRPSPLLPGGDLAKLLDIRSGDESPPATDQHDRADAVVIAKLLDSLQYALRDAGAESVHGGIFDCDNADATLDAQTDQVRHAFLLGLGTLDAASPPSPIEYRNQAQRNLHSRW